MRRAERVVDVDLGEGGELAAERRVVPLFAGVKSQVLEDEDTARLQGGDGLFRLGAYAVGREGDGSAEARLQHARHRGQRVLRILRALRLAEVRREDEAGAALPGEVEGGERLDDARVVPHDAVLERHVEVHAHEDALAVEVEVPDRARKAGHGVLLFGKVGRPILGARGLYSLVP